MGSQGHRRLDGGAVRAAAGRHRRHHPRLAHAGTGRATHAAKWSSRRRSCRPGPARVHADGHRLPGLRPHHQHRVPGTGQADSDATCATQMPVWREQLPGRRGHERGGDGLHRQRPGRDRSTPTSASACRAPASRRRRRSSSMARRSLTLRGEHIAEEFQAIVSDYVERTLRRSNAPRRRALESPEAIHSEVSSTGPHATKNPKARKAEIHGRQRHERHPPGRSAAVGVVRDHRRRRCCARYGYQQDPHADRRAHGAVRARHRRGDRHRREGDVLLRGLDERRAAHAAPGKHGRRRARGDRAQPALRRSASGCGTWARCSATSVRSAAATASSTRSAPRRSASPARTSTPS